MDLAAGQVVEKFQVYQARDIDKLVQLKRLGAKQIAEIKAVAAVFPFRVNNYVVEELINWDQIPDDPIFRLTFPQAGMLEDEDLRRMVHLISNNAPPLQIKAEARAIQMKLNPHPAGQMDLNVPVKDDDAISGIQHKYDETLLFFPTQGQTCHAYCTYCFRWAQFVGLEDLRFAARETDALVSYLQKHPDVTDVLITGGDPLVMKTKVLRRYLEPLIKNKPGGLATIRLGTKSTAYWPYRFLSDRDADDLLRLFEEVNAAGIHLSIMSHYSHPRELETPAAQAAVKRILSTGAVVRCQAPLIKGVNDNPHVWADMWRKQVALGAIPYYMFVERDTGPKHYFEVNLHRALDIFQDAYRQVSGLCRTVRGPSMSCTPGKVLIDGVCTIGGEKVFALKFIQGRSAQWVNKLFFAKYDPTATWFSDLKPAFGDDHFFFEDDLQQLREERSQLSARKEQVLNSQYAELSN